MVRKNKKLLQAEIKDLETKIDSLSTKIDVLSETLLVKINEIENLQKEETESVINYYKNLEEDSKKRQNMMHNYLFGGENTADKKGKK